MNRFTRRDPLAETAAKTLEKSRNMGVIDFLESYSRSATPIVNERGIFYIEDPDSILAINMFMKRFLEGMHMHPHDIIAKMFLNLQQIGLVVDDYDGESGIYNVFQHGRTPSDHPITGDEATDDLLFLRAGSHGKIKITKTAVPGGLYTVDAVFYLEKSPKPTK